MPSQPLVAGGAQASPYNYGQSLPTQAQAGHSAPCCQSEARSKCGKLQTLAVARPCARSDKCPTWSGREQPDAS
eukprot:CAMPEP_0119348608 /NCGR_PEP_ID=MMETSP1333-20130426/109133_1 /TAXON_ID=418940 /ORGANISM="Scyphosphaera apsteinii, Strain RCC1455" /LENGTH=73 /DNA_ID=CAMNT_0007361199 /DNA_START=745 /DNA_END=966 /DNA_ORIENTATION=+